MMNRINISIGILLLFHVIGLVLFILDPRNSDLSWLNMLICGAVLLVNEKNLKKNLGALSIIFFGGFLIEWIGTASGFLFGNYSYGSSLGIKVLGVPPMIGINWICIILASVAMANTFISGSARILRAFLAACFAVLMDYLIEPVAIRFDMWQWEDGVIPLYNYVCWFLFSLFFAWIYLRKASGINRSAQALYLIWAFFFLAIHLIL